MKFGKLKFSNWRRFSGCWEIYGSETDPTFLNYSFAITIYHDKKDRQDWNPPPQDYYEPLELSNWTISFYELENEQVISSEAIKNLHFSIYGKTVSATEKNIKKHVNNFIKRLNKIKIFI